MDKKLFLQAVVNFLGGLILVGLPLFLSAGTLSFYQAWILIGVLFAPMFAAGIVLTFKKPELLKKRLNTKEDQDEQKAVIAFSGLIFLAAFVTAGLNYRFGWWILPIWFSYCAVGVFLIGYGLYAEVLRENDYLSRVVEIQDNQKIIDTGLYGLVRHPMYMSTILMFLSMPLILGSVISFVIMLLYLPIIGKRIKNEEQVLEKGLDGYAEYKTRVRYKLIPFIW